MVNALQQVDSYGSPPPEASRLGLSQRDWTEIRDESVRVLQQLIAVDTSNPPGNETALATVLREYLEDAGIATELHGEFANRKNLVARARGNSPGPRLLLLSHSDVVPALEDDWIVPPFSGQLRDGCVWGRGALDMKNQIVAHSIALARLVRSGRSFNGEVILAVTSDEEVRTESGARWLVEHHKNLVDCDYLISEPVVDTVRIGNTLVVPLVVGEKNPAQFRLRVKGEGGHGSLPLHDLNVVVRLAEMISRLEKLEPATIISSQLAAYVKATVVDEDLHARLCDATTARAALKELARYDLRTARTLESLMGITYSPTVLRTNSASVNVIPSEASVDVDCRILPSQDESQVKANIGQALADFEDWEFEWLEIERSGESSASSRLSEALQDVVSRMVPGGRVMPVYCTAGTDIPWFRAAMSSIVAYGFCPSFRSSGGAMHGSNERISVDNLGLQTLFFEHALAELLK